MTESSPFDAYLDALRDDLPSAREEQRIRQRLATAGVAVATAVISEAAAGATTASTVAATANSAGTATAASAASASAASATALNATALNAMGTAAATKLGLVPTLLAQVVRLPLLAQLGLISAGTAAVATGPVVVVNHWISKSGPAQVAEPRRAPVHSPAVVPHNGSRVTLGQSAMDEGAALPTLNPSPASPQPHADVATASVRPELSQPRGDVTTTTSMSGIQPSAKRGIAESSGLAEETRLIDAALSAIRNGDLTLAAQLLNEHTTRFPNAKLANERTRALQKLDTARHHSPPQ
jgi:hypothetical protein